MALPLHSSTGDGGTFFWGFAFGPILALDAVKRSGQVATVALLPTSGFQPTKPGRLGLPAMRLCPSIFNQFVYETLNSDSQCRKPLLAASELGWIV